MCPPENLSGLPRGALRSRWGSQFQLRKLPHFPPHSLNSSRTSCLAFFQTYYAGSYLTAFALAVPSTFVPLFTQLIPTETSGAQRKSVATFRNPFWKLPLTLMTNFLLRYLFGLLFYVHLQDY